MQDLQEVTHDLHYENYRASRLADEPEANAPAPPQQKSSKRGGSSQGEAEKDRILHEKELELQKMQEMIAMMQAQLQAQQNQQTQPKESKDSGFWKKKAIYRADTVGLTLENSLKFYGRLFRPLSMGYLKC